MPPPDRARAAARRRPRFGSAARRRADALDELDLDAHAEHRGHDVREHHSGVDVVAAYGLECHLGAELGRMCDFEERVPLADRAVLGQRPPCLAHEPHGSALDGLAARRADEKRSRHGRSVAASVRRLGRRGAARTRLAGSEARASPGRRPHDGDGCARERRGRDLALARGGRSPTLLSLARPARKRDLLGRARGHRSRARCRLVERSSSRCSSTRCGRRGATCSRSISSRRTGSGSPRSVLRPTRSRSTSCRSSTRAGSGSSSMVVRTS